MIIGYIGRSFIFLNTGWGRRRRYHDQQPVKSYVNISFPNVLLLQSVLYIYKMCSIVRTILKAYRKTIDSFETWVWRRMLKITRTERISNEEPRNNKNKSKAVCMNNAIEKRRGKWIGHLLRNSTWTASIIEGKPGRRRPRQSYTKQKLC